MPSIRLIIDGYNLLHATNILSRSLGPGGLERARAALLNLLVESLLPEQVARTIVIFDAREAPWGVSKQLNHRGLNVQFAAKYDDADTLIEELIREHSAPKRLTVVSGDHRLHQAARRRKATAIDSDVWLRELLRQRRNRQNEPPEPAANRTAPRPIVDVDYWLREFSQELPSEQRESPRLRHPAANPPAKPADAAPRYPMQRAPHKPKPNRSDEKDQLDLDDPFPPGYADDLLDEK